MKPVVFLGPSLRRDEARQILDADYRPPAGQGDLLRAAMERPLAIALIDGVFKDAPTVRHREILWALSEGIPVFGAASMGALRAAELWQDGMVGAGLIFRWYRRFTLLPDDAVAVTHGPAEIGSPALSDALVDIRRALSAARRAGLITAHEHQDEVARARAESFPQRRVPQVAAGVIPSQKAADAKALLRQLARMSAQGNWPKPVTSRPPIVHAWLDDLADSGINLFPSDRPR